MVLAWRHQPRGERRRTSIPPPVRCGRIGRRSHGRRSRVESSASRAFGEFSSDRE